MFRIFLLASLFALLSRDNSIVNVLAEHLSEGTESYTQHIPIQLIKLKTIRNIFISLKVSLLALKIHLRERKKKKNADGLVNGSFCLLSHILFLSIISTIGDDCLWGTTCVVTCGLL